jgi:predicted ABC-type ATPase
LPDFYIIAGCNGAGKTTASKTILPEVLNCREFVNADEIAKGLSPFNSEAVSFEAGRIMLHRIKELSDQRVDFAIETTLATKSYKSLIKDLKQKGYSVILIFFWLNSVELAKNRVAERVQHGGHNIPEEVIERRYLRGLENLTKIFLPLVDRWFIYDNSYVPEILIAQKDELNLEVFDTSVYNKILNEK